MSDGEKKGPEHLAPYQFPKGKSGNPGGRPKELLSTLREKFGDRVLELVETLITIGLDSKEKAGDRVRAIDAALDRLIGKPMQEIEGSVGIGIAPEQLAMLQALALSPAQRRKKIEDLKAKAARPPAVEPADADE